MANKIYKLKVGDGVSSYDQLKFLGRKLTTKEKTYAVNSIVQKVIEYFKDNPIEYGLNGETDIVRPVIEAALNDGEHVYEFNLRIDTPYEGDDVININGMQITANYQYKTIKPLDESFQLPKPGTNTEEPEEPEEEPEIPTEPEEPEGDIEYYRVMFVYEDPTTNKQILYKIELVAKNHDAVLPTNNPSLTGYEFTSWDDNYKNIVEDTIVYGHFKEIENSGSLLKVRFFEDSTRSMLLKSEDVAPNADATAPVVNDKDDKSFVGWSKSFKNITKNTDVDGIWLDKVNTIESIETNKSWHVFIPTEDYVDNISTLFNRNVPYYLMLPCAPLLGFTDFTGFISISGSKYTKWTSVNYFKDLNEDTEFTCVEDDVIDNYDSKISSDSSMFGEFFSQFYNKNGNHEQFGSKRIYLRLGNFKESALEASEFVSKVSKTQVDGPYKDASLYELEPTFGRYKELVVDKDISDADIIALANEQNWDEITPVSGGRICIEIPWNFNIDNNNRIVVMCLDTNNNLYVSPKMSLKPPVLDKPVTYYYRTIEGDALGATGNDSTGIDGLLSWNVYYANAFATNPTDTPYIYPACIDKKSVSRIVITFSIDDYGLVHTGNGNVVSAFKDTKYNSDYKKWEIQFNGSGENKRIDSHQIIGTAINSNECQIGIRSIEIYHTEPFYTQAPGFPYGGGVANLYPWPNSTSGQRAVYPSGYNASFKLTVDENISGGSYQLFSRHGVLFGHSSFLKIADENNRHGDKSCVEWNVDITGELRKYGENNVIYVTTITGVGGDMYMTIDSSLLSNKDKFYYEPIDWDKINKKIGLNFNTEEYLDYPTRKAFDLSFPENLTIRDAISGPGFRAFDDVDDLIDFYNLDKHNIMPVVNGSIQPIEWSYNPVAYEWYVEEDEEQPDLTKFDFNFNINSSNLGWPSSTNFPSSITDIFFKADEYGINGQSAMNLEALCQNILATIGEGKTAYINCTGRASVDGNYNYNQILSENRANSAYDYITSYLSDHGVSSSDYVITTNSTGATGTTETKTENRSVSIIVSYK